MIDLKATQKEVYDNKVRHGFNTEDVELEFLYAHKELAEAFDAWHKKKDDLGEELADIMIFTMGIAEICDINLEEEIKHKIKKNAKREYKIVDGAAIRTKEADI